jgi:hypothetical protein
VDIALSSFSVCAQLFSMAMTRPFSRMYSLEDKPTVNGQPLLATPPTVTTILPVVAVAGTVVVMLVALQVCTVAETPWKVTVLVPWAAPKLVPAIVTEVPDVPEDREVLVIVGVTGVTVKVAGEEVPPLVVTVILAVPTLAIRLAGTAAVNCVALTNVVVSAVEPHFTAAPARKFVPVTVRVKAEPPTVTEVGLRLVMVGTGMMTVNEYPALGETPLLLTITEPVVAPMGMTTAMLVFVQLLNVVAATPLNVTVLFQRLVPKLAPVIVTEAPTAPDDGEILLMVGVDGVLMVKVSVGAAATPATYHVCVKLPTLAVVQVLALDQIPLAFVVPIELWALPF